MSLSRGLNQKFQTLLLSRLFLMPYQILSRQLFGALFKLTRMCVRYGSQILSKNIERHVIVLLLFNIYNSHLRTYQASDEILY
jgi:hypothetical protein